MAKYTVSCEGCQTELTVQLYGPGRDRQWKLDNWTWKCDACIEAEKKEASAKAATEAQTLGLPELTGTPKQMAWAETLRMSILRRIENEATQESEYYLRRVAYLVKRAGIEAYDHLTLAALLTALKSRTDARFWIDSRQQSAIDLLVVVAGDVPTPEKQVMAELEADAAAEVTVRPQTVVSETVAEIRAFSDRIEVHFPEKREDFWQLIKKQLHFRWADTCWVRRITIKTGDVQDRAAEAGHRILAAGFPIRIYDDQLRRRAIAGEFKPECVKWVMARTDGKYSGWFAIEWWPSAGDFYREAKRLAASRYDKPSVVVPAEQFVEVLGFAEVHGFELSPGAAKLVEKARAAKEAALTVKVEKKPAPEKTKDPSKAPTLEVPEAVDIQDDLKDELQ